MKKTLRMTIIALALLTVSACTITPSKLTPDQSARLEQAKAQCTKESVFPKVHPSESRNQSGVRTDYFYDCMKKAGFTEG